MLSRVADSLFWLSRYLERAEHIARLMDVGYHFELDFAGLDEAAQDGHWQVIAQVLQQNHLEASSANFAEQLVEWLTFDPANPDSIISCINKARNNARAVRGAITAEMWQELNKLYWRLRDQDFAVRAKDSPHEFFRAVEIGSQHIQGVGEATLNRDEGWYFLQLGRFLERADKTLRILDASYMALDGSRAPTDLPMSNLQWAGVLRSCAAYHAYQRLNVGRVEPDKVVEFILLNASSPRSVRFSLESAAVALNGIEGSTSSKQASKPYRLLGKLISDLEYLDLEPLLEHGLHEFHADLIDRVQQVGLAVQEQFTLI